MRHGSIFAVSVAFAGCTLLCPGLASAKEVNSNAGFHENVPPAVAKREAAQMVPAEAVLAQDINAKKMHDGQQFQAKLASSIQLKNGTELPKGTVLVGRVVTDNMDSNGRSTLALRFTQADLKDGKTIPIQAAVMGIAPPEYGAGWQGGVAGTPAPVSWNGQTLQMDQVGALSGVDLHSRIAGNESAVLISNKKDNMKLRNQSQLSLAIGLRGSNNQENSGA